MHPPTASLGKPESLDELRPPVERLASEERQADLKEALSTLSTTSDLSAPTLLALLERVHEHLGLYKISKDERIGHKDQGYELELCRNNPWQVITAAVSMYLYDQKLQALASQPALQKSIDQLCDLCGAIGTRHKTEEDLLIMGRILGDMINALRRQVDQVGDFDPAKAA